MRVLLSQYNKDLPVAGSNIKKTKRKEKRTIHKGPVYGLLVDFVPDFEPWFKI